MTDITIPDGLWEDGAEAALSTWFYADGDHVAAGAVVAEIMVEKTSYEIQSPAGGTLHIAIAEEQMVAPGQCIGRIS
ncbi:MAG: lipoyl domain-containing protein [Blastomonas sp.]